MHYMFAVCTVFAFGNKFDLIWYQNICGWYVQQNKTHPRTEPFKHGHVTRRMMSHEITPGQRQ